jgi:GH43 family beta-xylosidase
MRMGWMVGVLAVVLGGASCGVAQKVVATNTFTNPVLEQGPDPWVVYWKGFYYYSNTEGSNLTLRKTSDITDLRDAEVKAVWTPEPGHAWSKEVWAPELHRWGKRWVIYFAADAGENSGHRIFVVENDSDDPMEGTWTLLGKVSDATDRWAIDATMFELRGQHYLVWAGWKGAVDGEQDIFIAHLSDPQTIDSPRTMISQPMYDWEKQGDLPGRHVDVNEGPEFLRHGKKMFIVYSASGCWTDHYSLGAVEASVDADPLEATSWRKIDHPLLSTDASAHAYSPGHNGFFKSPDGREDWIIYHANPEAGQGCGGMRSPRIQRFMWGKDGLPEFGSPVGLGVRLAKPGR